VYDADLVRKLCSDIIKEEDSQRVDELISLLQAVIKEDQEEIRVRMVYLAKKYSAAFESEGI